jgi:hypothetical protein
MNLVRLPMSSLPNAVSNAADLWIAMDRINRSVSSAWARASGATS